MPTAPPRTPAPESKGWLGAILIVVEAPWVDDVFRVLMTFPSGTINDDVDVCSLFGRMLDPVQVFGQDAVQRVLSEDVQPLFGGA